MSVRLAWLTSNDLNHANLTGIGIICDPSGVIELSFNVEEMKDGILVWNESMTQHFEEYDILAVPNHMHPLMLPKYTLTTSGPSAVFHLLVNLEFFEHLPRLTSCRGVVTHRGMHIFNMPYSFIQENGTTYKLVGGHILKKDRESGRPRIVLRSIRSNSLLKCLDNYHRTYPDQVTREGELLGEKPGLDRTTIERTCTDYVSKPSAIKLLLSNRRYIESIRRGLWSPGRLPSQVKVYSNRKKRRFVIRAELYDDYVLWCGNRIRPDNSHNFSDAINHLTGASTEQLVNSRKRKVFYLDVIEGLVEPRRPIKTG